MIVLKIGGQQLDDPEFLAGLARLAGPHVGSLVIVHGGGKATTELSERLGLVSTFVEGLRVTDAETLKVAVMGLVGTASATLVSALVAEGVPALGLSGLDAHLVVCQPKSGLGWVGEPVSVHVERLRALVQAGFLPCLAPICLTSQGSQLYNVNADPVAAAVAAQCGARALVFVTNVRAVLRDGRPVLRLTVDQAQVLIDDGVITGGMTPKIRAAFAALKAGVAAVLITDLEGLGAWLRGETAGTVVLPGSREDVQN